MLKYSRSPGLDMKVFSLPCWSNRVQTHLCDGCVWIQHMSGAHSSFWLAPAGSLSYAEKNYQVLSDVIRLLNCQQRDHVCTILMSTLLKLCKNLPFIQFWSRCKPAPVDDSNESLTDLFHLNTFIYKLVQSWVIGILFSKQKIIVFIFLMDLHLLHIMTDGEIPGNLLINSYRPWYQRGVSVERLSDLCL